MARPKYDEASLEKIKVIQSNLQRLAKENKLSQTEISKKTGIPKSTISDYFRGETLINPGNMYLVAEALGVTTEDIYFKKVERPTNLIPIQPNIVQIPILGKIACGDPITAEQNIEGYTYEFADYLPRGEIFALIAKGDSMEPTIMNGSKVFIRVQSDVENGEMAAVLVNGDTEATLKRIKKQDSTIFLMPDNPSHDPIIVGPSNPARIIGKVVRAIMDFD
ncbi:XRE family transcriptional regulator [Lysinibacillus pakistanensis]|uniref:LexA family protein n=1 Tax=Lysinibacillus pakistanensis TaxID=759811 RepID=UPI003D2E8D98